MRPRLRTGAPEAEATIGGIGGSRLMASQPRARNNIRSGNRSTPLWLLASLRAEGAGRPRRFTCPRTADIYKGVCIVAIPLDAGQKGCADGLRRSRRRRSHYVNGLQVRFSAYYGPRRGLQGTNRQWLQR